MFNKLIVLFWLLCFTARAQEPGCLTADAVILIDWSSSVGGNEKVITTAASTFIDQLSISDYQLRIGIITFATYADEIVELSGDKTKIQNNLNALSHRSANGGTQLDDALNVAGKMLVNNRNVLKMIIIISDGEIYDLEDAINTMNTLNGIIPLSTHAIFIKTHDGTYIDDSTALDNLNKLTGNPLYTENTKPTNLIEALKRLNLCN